jgi:hypothetical protein
LSFFISFPVCRRSTKWIGGGGEGGAKSYDREKAWPSINHSILSGENLLYGNPLYVLIKETDYIHICTILVFTYCIAY